MSLVEQELLTLTEHLSSPLVFSGVCIIRSLVLCVCFVDRCLSFCTFGHCVVCSSSIYRFWLPLWYLQTLLSAKLVTYVLTFIQIEYTTHFFLQKCGFNDSVCAFDLLWSIYSNSSHVGYNFNNRWFRLTLV